ncbi:hypothetical protein PQX77_006282 [Marasmius sp. AFHP31]|nr:hypothetical protein PQX77_006282 [Marasmius sp. AFHP31]
MSFYDPLGQQIDLLEHYRPPKNPLRHGDFDFRAPSEPQSQFSLGMSLASSLKHDRQRKKESETILRRLIRTDQRAVLTGANTALLQASHLVNAIRRKKSVVKKGYKEAVERYLTTLEFAGNQNFKLDGRANLILLNVEDHYALGMYGLIAFSPGKVFLEGLRNQLRSDNEDWDRRTRSRYGFASRDLKWNQGFYDAYQADQWEVLVLCPEDLLSDGQRRLVLPHSKRTWRASNKQVPTPCTMDDWILCHVIDKESEARLGFLDRGEEKPLKLTFHDLRERKERVSVFSLITNLASKLRTHRRYHPEDARFDELFELVEDVMGLIFHVPKGDFMHPNMQYNAIVNPPLPVNAQTTPLDVVSTSAGTVQTMPIAIDSAPHGTSTVNKDRRNDTDDENPGRDGDSDSDSSLSCEDWGKVAEITDDEMQLLFARQFSPNLTDQERADNFMQILYGPLGHPPFDGQTPVEWETWD